MRKIVEMLIKDNQSISLIPLTRNKFAIIDSEDFERISKYKWNCLKTGYASTSVGGRKNKIMLYMHRVIMFPCNGFVIDHINGNKLDNRKSNLRWCLQSENSKNRIKSSIKNKTSIFKGVYKRKDGRKKCWTAIIKINRKNLIIGSFYEEKEAALAYNKAAKKYYGNFAKLNEVL